jgi:multidrug efflux system outer membrane protein
MNSRMQSLHYLVLFFLALVFSTCKVGKNYERPPLDLPAQFSASAFSDTAGIGGMEWKQFFTEAELQRLIEKGLAYNHDLLAGFKRLEMAQQQVKQSRLQQIPELNLLIGAQISRPSANSLSGLSIKNFLGRSYLENYTAGLNLSWEADIWGKIRRQKETVLADYLRSAEAVKAIQTRLVADISHGYFNLLMLDKQLDVARKNLALSDSFLVATRLMKTAGMVTMLAVEQAESQKRAVALLIPQLEQDIALQENTLQLLTGQLPGIVDRKASLPAFSLPDEFATGVPLAIVSRRPDVRASEMSLISANARVGIAKANMYPTLNITAGTGLESFQSGNWFSIPNSVFGIAAGAIAQPVFKRRALKTQFEVARLQREEAVIQFRQSVLKAGTEVANALVQTDKLKQQRQIATGQVDTLLLASSHARLLFKSDMASYLEVITAQGNVLQAELNLAFIQRQQLGAMVELYRALGGGWK